MASNSLHRQHLRSSYNLFKPNGPGVAHRPSGALNIQLIRTKSIRVSNPSSSIEPNARTVLVITRGRPRGSSPQELTSNKQL